MKRFLKTLLVLSIPLSGFAQGLDGIVAEKYYVSNSVDASGSIGALPNGSVTWRIYADLATGYKLQAAYGVANHPLIINTTTTFFNNEDRGSYIPNWTKAQAADNTVMLDSYLTMGSVTTAGTGSEFGIMKTEDNATANIVNANGILQNNDPSAGIPLTSRDGFITGNTQNIQLVGITPANLSMFDNTSQIGSSFSTSNGSIAALNGATGPTSTNRVLIAQITTTGIVHYELNLQIINSTTGVVSNYVASNPTGSEQTSASLIGNLGVSLSSEPSTIGTLSFSSTTSASMVLNFTSGNGAKRLVFGRAGGAVTAVPVDGTTYTANASFGLGTPVGTGNFTVYNGTGNTVTLTNLSSNTNYYFRVIEFNDGGQAGAENYLTSTFVSGNNITSATGTTYTWNQSGSGSFDWTTASNWTPARNLPAIDDVLLFNNGATGITISNVPTQTIGRLAISNNSNITLVGNGSSILNIRGVSTNSDDLGITAGSTLNLSGSSSVSFNLSSGATGIIQGTVNLGTTNRIISSSANSIKFTSGSNCTVLSNYSGAAFGTPANNANTIVFESGATYTHNNGDNPFQRTAPSSIVIFKAGSNQIWNSTSGFDVSGRTFGNLTINSVLSATNSGAFSFGNLTIGSTGQITINAGPSSSISIKGGVTNNASSPAVFNAGSGGITAATNSVLNGTGGISLLATNGGNFTIPTGIYVSTNQTGTVNNIALNGTLTFTSPVTWNINGTISGSGTINSIPAYCANLNFLSSANPIGSFKTTSTALNNLTINRPATTSTLTSPLVIWGVLTMTDGTLASNGNLRLGSIASRQGIISGSGNGSVTGNVIVDRFVPASGLGKSPARLISCPVTGLTTNTAWGDDFSVIGTTPYTYNPSAPSPAVYPTIWSYDDSNVSPETAYESANGATIDPMDGFYANLGLATTSNYTLDVVGPVNNGALSVSLPATVNGNHFVGNPYPSPIRWSLLRNLGGQVGLQSSYYGWSSANNAFGYFNGTVGTFNLNDTIALGQAISVTTNTPAGGTLIMNNSIRHGSINPSFSRKANPDFVCKLSLEGLNGKDQMALYSINGGNNSFNPESDAVKIEAAPEDLNPQISANILNRHFAIKEFGELSKGTVIPLIVNIKETGNYSIKAEEIVGNIQGSLYLVDQLTGIKTAIKNGSSIDLYLQTGNYETRFFLEISNDSEFENASGTLTMLDASVGENSIRIFSNTNQGFSASIDLFETSGKLVFSSNQQIFTGTTTVPLPEISKGVYILKINGASQLLNKKLLIP